jgi:Trk K+ transport system NAD-binding subunit
MISPDIQSRWRKVRASWRDTLLLLREFRQPLILFILLITGAGWLFYTLSQGSEISSKSISEAMYVVLTLTFLQPINPFPQAWYLQVFYFVMPVAGIGILAQGLAEFGELFFNRRARGKEWQMAVASTMSNHIILVGLGHLGFRVARRLYEIHRDVVVVEAAPKPNLIKMVHQMDVPAIQDDATREDVLLAAGIQKARTIMLCTQNDSLNLEIALKARKLNPSVEVVVRIFDDDFAESLQKQFGFHALSATGMAAPIFAAAAVNVDITPPISIEGQAHILARLQVNGKSQLIGKSVNQIEEQFHTSLVSLRTNGDTLLHPQGDLVIQTGDTLAFFGTPEQINQIIHENR